MTTNELQEKAASYFYSGFNCAQSTALAFADILQLDKDEVQRAMAGFGGGIAGRRETCGAVSGIVYIAGLCKGDYDPNNNVDKTAFYEAVRNAIAEFENEFGTTMCKELLEKYDIAPQTNPQERNEAYYRSRPCDKFIKKAVGIIVGRFFN